MCRTTPPCVCMCVLACVSKWERERERGLERANLMCCHQFTWPLQHTFDSAPRSTAKSHQPCVDCWELTADVMQRDHNQYHEAIAIINSWEIFNLSLNVECLEQTSLHHLVVLIWNYTHLVDQWCFIYFCSLYVPLGTIQLWTAMGHLNSVSVFQWLWSQIIHILTHHRLLKWV